MHKNACLLSLLALTVWRAAPKQFPAFDHFLFKPSDPRAPAEALAEAVKLVGTKELQQELTNAWPRQQMERDVEAWNTAGAKEVPKLIVGHTLIPGDPPKKELFSVIEKYSSLKFTKTLSTPIATTSARSHQPRSVTSP